MKLSLSWNNSGHPLLQGAKVEFAFDNSPLPVTLGTGTATTDLPAVAAGELRMIVTFVPNLSGLTGEVLRIEQRFKVTQTLGAKPVLSPPTAFDYTLLTGAARRVRRVSGLHPMLTSKPLGGSWSLALNIKMVDLTRLQPFIMTRLNQMRPRANGTTPPAEPRVLARLDGVKSLLWITCTPEVCRSAADVDVLCMFTPPQHEPVAPPLIDQLTTNLGELGHRVAVFLGTGTENGGTVGNVQLFDHFVPDPAKGGALNFPIARGYEAAMIASGKRTALVLPVPSGGSHNEAGGAALPGFLDDVYLTLHALGDIVPPLLPGSLEDTEALIPAVQFGVAAHSNGGGALFKAVAAHPSAFVDIQLYEAQETQSNLPTLTAAKRARICFAGYATGTVAGPFATASGQPGLSGRIRRLPVPSTVAGEAPPEAAPLTQLVSHAPVSLGHAFSANGIAPTALGPLDRWDLLHQYCVWGADDQGTPGKPEQSFVAQALAGATLR